MDQDILQQRILELEPELIRLYRDFHQYPELGFREFQTAEKIEAFLAGIGLEPGRMSETGVVAVLDSGKPGPCLMLRADTDGLPVTEATGLPHASQNPGVMHACGHDAHMAMLLSAARILAENRSAFCGRIKFVFQPDEEVGGGKRMVADGVLEDPAVDAVMALHIWSQIPSGRVSIAPGTVMGGLDVFKMHITGKGGHTGAPHKAVDPVIAAASVIQAVQSVQTRELDAREPTLIMFGKLRAGEKANIIPESVFLEGTIRFLTALDEDDPDSPTNRFIRICKDTCRAFGCDCRIDIEHENIPLVNDPGLADLGRKSARAVYGGADIIEANRYTASEDFSEFSARVPGLFVFLGCADPEKGTDVPHHNPGFNIDETVLKKGVALHVSNALAYLNGQG